MTDTAKARDNMDLLSLYRPNAQTLQFAVWPLRMALELQACMLGAVAPAVDNWFKRRSEGTASALHALDRLAACSEPLDASQVQAQWIQEETRRLGDDWHALTAGQMRLAEEMGKALRPESR